MHHTQPRKRVSTQIEQNIRLERLERKVRRLESTIDAVIGTMESITDDVGACHEILRAQTTTKEGGDNGEIA